MVAGARPSGRAAIVAALSAVILAAAVAAAAPASPPTVSEVRLPRTWPQPIALGSDGSIWAGGQYGGVTRLEPNGRIRNYGTDDEYAADLVTGPDGAIWIAATEVVMRIDDAGHRQSWRVPGGWAHAITSADGSLWLTSETLADRIVRLGTDGSMRALTVKGPRRNALMSGISAGPDGALWFTQTSYAAKTPDGIGRMTAEGRSTSWPLPHRLANPTRIAAGSDGALWFTEPDAHAIGRITTSGAITEFPLTTGLSPDDIEPGPDGALWFTADGCIGRITTAGRETAWPVAGAGRLLGIVAAPDGSIWAADGVRSALWHFIPPAGDAAPRTPCAPPTITRRARATSATLVYRREAVYGVDYFSDPRVRISRAGKQLFAETVPPIEGGYRFPVVGDTSSFAVRDLDGDHEPEVMLELNSNGAHCCAWSRVYRYSRGTYRPLVHFWSDDAASPRIRDLNGDGRPEFRSVDARFAYAFASYAGSWMPIQIWSHRHGRFHNVTRRFSAQVRQDAARIWRFYLRHRRLRGETVRGSLAAWAADEYLLGRRRIVWPTLERVAHAGYLDYPKGGGFPGPQKAQAYIRQLRAFLHKLGYAR